MSTTENPKIPGWTRSRSSVTLLAMDGGRIETRLYASLRKWNLTSYSFVGTTTVKDFLRNAGIREEDVGIVVINGKRQQLDTGLQDGDVVSLFPLIDGG